MHSNKFWYAWLGQGGGLKAVWKGFGRSIKLKENFADLIFQNFWSKTAEIGKILLAFVGLALRRVGTTLAHTTGKNSMRYAFWRVTYTQHTLEACEPVPFTPKMRRLWGKDSIAVQLLFSGQVDHARVNLLWGNLLRKNPESDDTEFGQGDVTQRVACLRFP